MYLVWQQLSEKQTAAATCTALSALLNRVSLTSRLQNMQTNLQFLLAVDTPLCPGEPRGVTSHLHRYTSDQLSDA